MSFFSKKSAAAPVYTLSFGTLSPEGVGAADARLQASDMDWSWDGPEGKLAVDVAETEQGIIVISTLAGAVYADLEVHLHEDVLTIRGVRESPLPERPDINFIHEECYWGKFSRTIVLPATVRADAAKAEYRNGILVVTIPKRAADARVPVVIVEE